METIPKTDCTQVGFFRKTHGVHGELVLEYEPVFEPSVEKVDRFFVELEGLLVPFFISENGFRFKSSKSAIIKFDWVDTENYARRLVGSSAWLFNHEIVLEEDELPVSIFAGFILEDEKLGKIGKITSVDDFSGNLVLNVDYKGAGILVPFNEDFLVLADEEQKILKLNLPDGLIDI
jgi:16S rRNA processing protein RimM